MGILDKHRLERKKYISIADFINLIAFIKGEMVTDIISYFVINDLEKNITSYNIDLHGRILDSGHIENYGFDLNTRLFLEEGSCTFFFELYITYLNSNKIKKDFYYLKDELNSIEFIKELNLDFNLQAQANKAVSKWNNEQKEDRIYRASEKADFNKPNDHQLGFFKQDEFSITDAACLLAGVDCSSVIHYQNHPEFTQVYYDYISYKLMIELAIDNDELYCINGTIAKIVLQKYLFSIGYIVKGFNDWLTIEPAKYLVDNKPSDQFEASHNELKEAKAKINELRNELAQAKAELADKPADDNIKQDHLHNWQAMDKNQYPPELHLAIEIWKEYYQVDAIKRISQFDAGRFNRIANEFNLSKGNLKSRIRSLLTPLESKLKSPSLIENLKEIDIIHTDKLEQN
ncbi:hypothetical protein [Psychrobacter glacincola]|uniref:hypothetical protein n=1 Tax=Psychrobacter glacincola TaxID=56810 RepID=UPI003CFDB32B